MEGCILAASLMVMAFPLRWASVQPQQAQQLQAEQAAAAEEGEAARAQDGGSEHPARLFSRSTSPLWAAAMCVAGGEQMLMCPEAIRWGWQASLGPRRGFVKQCRIAAGCCLWTYVAKLQTGSAVQFASKALAIAVCPAHKIELQIRHLTPLLKACEIFSFSCPRMHTQVPSAARTRASALPASLPPACPLHGQCSAAARAGGQRQQQHGVAARRHRCFLSALHASMQLIQRRRPPDACEGGWGIR